MDGFNKIEDYVRDSGTDPDTQERMTVMLKALCIYRPEMGYIKGMGRLAQMLASQLDEEETGFQVLVNLLHRFHFLSFYRGEIREMQWRVQYVDTVFQQEVPLLHL